METPEKREKAMSLNFLYSSKKKKAVVGWVMGSETFRGGLSL